MAGFDDYGVPRRAQALVKAPSRLSARPSNDLMPKRLLKHSLEGEERDELHDEREQEWSYRHTEAGVVRSVTRIKAWFQTLDDEMKAAIAAFSDEDVNKAIDRGGDAVPVAFQLDVYLQAVLIFLGKATIYLKAMNEELPQSFQEYIG